MLMALLSAASSPVAPADYRAYVEKYARTAVAEMHRSGVPASITLAQGLLESAAGTSTLAVKANNHFGVKCHSDWKGKTIKHDDDAAGECFRVYPNAAASFRDHSDFLRYNDRYKPLFDLKPDDYRSWARGLKKAGYATDPKYADKLINLIEEYELYRYDSRSDIPEPPAALERPVEVSVAEASENFRFALTREIFKVNGVPFVIACEGDTYESLAAVYSLFPSEILRYNDLPAGTVAPKAGDRVYIGLKKCRTPRNLDKYIVASDGESLREISQRFGVRLSSLRSFNPALREIELRQGDTVYLRK